MIHSEKFKIQEEESDIRKFIEMFLRNRILFISSLVIALVVSFLINRYSVPVYSISSSILINENKYDKNNGSNDDFLNSNLFSRNQNFQNELKVLQSSPVIDQTIRNLNLEVSYYQTKWIQKIDSYKKVPFKVMMMSGHPQPIDIIFDITFLKDGTFQIEGSSQKPVSFYNFEKDQITHQKKGWYFIRFGSFGDIIETSDLSFIIHPDTAENNLSVDTPYYQFGFSTVASIRDGLRENIEFKIAERLSTVIEINLRSGSLEKGKDILNELMNVYSEQNLRQKNHIASITIEYIEEQLDEISDSLDLTEDNLQKFRSSNQLLNISDQSAGISAQYLSLQNQLAELVSRKRYYDYVSEYLSMNVNFSNIMLPAALGIQDQLLNNLMSELIASQAQRSNLIENNQERNPLVQKLGIQIDNLKKTISENIAAVGRTTSLSIDEMKKRISGIEAQISRIPITQRKLGNIERKYRLNDAIYSYLMEKHAEAKITKASNLPDDIIVEPANMVGLRPVSPNIKMNYLIAFFLGLAFPIGFLSLKSAINNKIETQDDIEKLTAEPVLGKILHNTHKTRNVMFDLPKSNIAESFRALRTNLDFYVRGGQKKVIMVTSCLQGEGKTFVAINLAMSYAQLGRKTILVNFDFRKPETYFKETGVEKEGLSSYMINKIGLEDIIIKSPNEKLDYILPGILPPNPVELLALEKTQKLFARLKNDYDVIVLDTTPLAQVTDAYLFVDHAELKIIVARQNYTLKKIFSLVMKDLKLKKVGNVCIVLNDTRMYFDKYGYGYEYGYNNKDFQKKSEKEKRILEEYFAPEVICRQ